MGLKRWVTLAEVAFHLKVWVEESLMPVLPSELVDVVRSTRDGDVELIDPVTLRPYVVVSRELYESAIAALRREDDRRAILEGLAEIERGEGIPIDEARRRAREHINGLPS
jgi:hypothetical protein